MIHYLKLEHQKSIRNKGQPCLMSAGYNFVHGGIFFFFFNFTFYSVFKLSFLLFRSKIQLTIQYIICVQKTENIIEKRSRNRVMFCLFGCCSFPGLLKSDLLLCRLCLAAQFSLQLSPSFTHYSHLSRPHASVYGYGICASCHQTVHRC